MEDYYSKVYNLPEDKLVAEIERLNKQLFKMSGNSPMYNQLLEMVRTAQTAYDELAFRQRVKVEEAKVIEIGTIEHEVIIPDYNTETLLTAIVDQYRKG